MAAQQSAGLLMCRVLSHELEYFLVHPGGPFFRNKDQGAWTIPKGLVDARESLEAAAIREFQEETALSVDSDLFPLGKIRMKNGKIVHAWGFMGWWDEASGIISNTFDLEWPPRSGKLIKVPEADRARWFSYEDALTHILPAQQPFIERAKESFCQGVFR